MSMEDPLRDFELGIKVKELLNEYEDVDKKWKVGILRLHIDRLEMEMEDEKP